MPDSIYRWNKPYLRSYRGYHLWRFRPGHMAVPTEFDYKLRRSLRHREWGIRRWHSYSNAESERSRRRLLAAEPSHLSMRQGSQQLAAAFGHCLEPEFPEWTAPPPLR